MGERLSREYGVRVEIHAEGPPFPVGPQATHELMMVAREGFFNSILHGRSNEIHVNLRFSERSLDMAILDDGQGFDVAAAPSDGHYGLQGVRERVNRFGGGVEIESKPKDGTRLSVSIPRSNISS